MIFYPEDFIRMGVALLIGGIIGAERERQKKAVGLRTLILISVGSAIFTIISFRMSELWGGEPSRIAAQIVSGIGFLGAGVILEERGRVVGLTTAATIWLTAALGMAVGAGEYILAVGGTGISIIVLLLFTRLEEHLNIASEGRLYRITTKTSWEKFKEIKSLVKEHHLTIDSYKQEKDEKEMVCTFETYGQTKHHDKLVQKLMADKEIKELWF